MITDDLHEHHEVPSEGKEGRRKKRLPAPPKSIVPIRCSDKRGAEHWDAQRARDLANFPSPFRMLLLGPPNTGKSTLIKNIIMHIRPRFKEVYVVHPDAHVSHEYDDLEPTEKFTDIPPLEFWDNDGPYIKRALVIDDLEYTSATKQRLHDLALTFRYCSSHKGLSVFLAHQSWFDTPLIVKKMSNIYTVWKPRARNELTMIENRVGMPQDSMKEIFNTIARGPMDSICVDLTRSSPAPLRVNIWYPVVMRDQEEDGEEE